MLIRKHFYHPGFHGSFSLKSVLPALIPDMNYKTLTIQEDSQASFDYLRMLDPFIPSGERRRIKEDLLNYCSYGTLAMVKIREELLKLILLNDPDKANARRIWSWNWDHAMPISGSLKFSSAGGGLVSIFRHVMKY